MRERDFVRSPEKRHRASREAQCEAWRQAAKLQAAIKPHRYGNSPAARDT